MLVLKVGKHERVRLKVGDTEIWVALLTAGDGKQRLAFDAPASVQVDREAVAVAKDAERRAA